MNCPHCGAAKSFDLDSGNTVRFECMTEIRFGFNKDRFQSHECEARQRNALKAKVESMEQELEDLREWKRQAMEVEREWDPNSLCLLLNGAPGASQRRTIAEKVPKLIARVKRLEELLGVSKAVKTECIFGKEAKP